MNTPTNSEALPPTTGSPSLSDLQERCRRAQNRHMAAGISLITGPMVILGVISDGQLWGLAPLTVAVVSSITAIVIRCKNRELKKSPENH